MQLMGIISLTQAGREIYNINLFANHTSWRSIRCALITFHALTLSSRRYAKDTRVVRAQYGTMQLEQIKIEVRIRVNIHRLTMSASYPYAGVLLERLDNRRPFQPRIQIGEMCGRGLRSPIPNRGRWRTRPGKCAFPEADRPSISALTQNRKASATPPLSELLP